MKICFILLTIYSETIIPLLMFCFSYLPAIRANTYNTAVAMITLLGISYGKGASLGCTHWNALRLYSVSINPTNIGLICYFYSQE